MNIVVAVLMKMRKHKAITRFVPPILLICGLAGLVMGFSAQNLFAQEAASTWASTSSDPLFDSSCPDGPDCIANRYPDWGDTLHVPPGSLRQPIDQGGLALPSPTPFANVGTYAQPDAQIGQIDDSGLNAASIDSNNSRGGEDGGSAPIEYRSPANFSQGFDNVTLLPGQEWFFRNNSSPTGSNNWFQGNNEAFTAQAGAANAYIAANFNNTAGSTGTISNWMVTPVLTLANGNTFSFWTRTPAGSVWPDRLELRLSTAGASTNVGSTATSVGDFSTLLLSVNPSLAQGGYPESWTRYSVTLAGIPGGATGRFAFRYYVTDGGPSGANSSYIGIDTVEYTGSLANFSCSSVTQIPQSECQALVALHNSTNGPGWINNTDWLVSNAPCSWYGVYCFSGHVAALELSQNNLSGNIPRELGNLPELVYVNFYVNHLVGEIPPELGQLSNLTSLQLGGNQLVGGIPREFGSLIRLVFFTLWGNGVTGDLPLELGNLVHLEVMDLSSNSLSGTIPSTFGNLSSIKVIDLYNNQLSGAIPVQLTGLANLESLNLDNNQLAGPLPPQFGILANLKHLRLSRNQLSGAIPSGLGNLTNLLVLSVGSNQLSGNIPSQLGNLTNLQVLDLSFNQLSGSIPLQLGSLANLQRLYLASNQLSGSIPSQLGNLANLQYLWLSSNQLSGSIPFQLGSLNNLQYLSLSTNQLNGNIPFQLGNLSGLQYLFLSSNQLSGSIPFQLGNLNSLQELGLSSNQLSGSIPSQLGNLPNLRYLSLSGNQVTGSIPSQLGNLTNLEILYLSSNQLTGNVPSQLSNLTNLQYLSLSFNQLTGSIPFQLGNLTNLRGMSLWNNQLGGNIPPELGALVNLVALDLEGNQLTGTIPSQLGNLTNLVYLYLDRNQLAGDIPVGVGNLTNLQYLGLSRNQLRGSVPGQFCNLNNLAEGDLDLGFNSLVSGPACINSKDPDWAATQTVPPTGLQASAQSPNQVRLTWTPILYTGDGGYYEVSYAISSGGPFSVHGTTADKSASSYVVTGLAPGTTFFFRVRTHTPAHGDQQNNLWSDYSATVSSTTGFATRSQYLPLVLNRFAPIPGAPGLNAITPPGANPSYSIIWNPATSATSYLLQRATNASFTDATQVYAGGSTAYTTSSQGIARYFYRVQARNQWGSSPWSNVQSVEVRWEREPNNTYDIANGPLNSGFDHFGFPNDASDYFFFQTTRRGQITIDLNIHTGQGIQLLLYYPAGTLVGQDITEPYRLEYTGDPGRYYVRVYSTGGFNSATPYSLRVVLP